MVTLTLFLKDCGNLDTSQAGRAENHLARTNVINLSKQEYYGCR